MILTAEHQFNDIFVYLCGFFVHHYALESHHNVVYFYQSSLRIPYKINGMINAFSSDVADTTIYIHAEWIRMLCDDWNKLFVLLMLCYYETIINPVCLFWFYSYIHIYNSKQTALSLTFEGIQTKNANHNHISLLSPICSRLISFLLEILLSSSYSRIQLRSAPQTTFDEP